MRPALKSLICGLGILLIAALFSCVGLARYYRIYSIGGWMSYCAMASECPREWREFHFGRFGAGADIEEVIRETKPSTVDRRGDWVTLRYQQAGLSGLVAHAHHGKLVCAYAGSCTWVRLLVDDMSEAESQELMGVSLHDPRIRNRPCLSLSYHFLSEFPFPFAVR